MHHLSGIQIQAFHPLKFHLQCKLRSSCSKKKKSVLNNKGVGTMKLNISQLSKTYSNGVQALKNINLEIGTGIFGLLGPNGAGKSTLMRTIATLQNPDSGSILFDGIDVLKQPNELRKILGYLPQEFGLYPRISAEMLLDHLAVLKGITNNQQRRQWVAYLLDKTNIYEHRKKNLGGFSGGMKQRFGIAQALLSNPKLIIVDEPTAGLDPLERNRFYNILNEISENTVVILSTHIVDDVMELCPKMAIIKGGEFLTTGSPNEAIDQMGGKVWRKAIDKKELNEIRNHFKVISEKLVMGKRVVHIYSDTQPDSSFEMVGVDLKDVYFSQVLLNEAPREVFC